MEKKITNMVSVSTNDNFSLIININLIYEDQKIANEFAKSLLWIPVNFNI
jgi:hypothetical protein